MNFLGMGPMELMMILVLALIVFGPGKLPEIAGQVGRVVRDFRRTTSELSSEFSRTISLEMEERKAPRSSSAATAEAEVEYEAPAADTVEEYATAATAEVPAAAEAPSTPVIGMPAPVVEAVPVAAAAGTSRRRMRDAEIEPPY